MDRTLFPVHVSAYTLTTALGSGLGSHLRAIERNLSGLQALSDRAADTLGLQKLPKTWVGIVGGLDTALPRHLAHWDCRNHRLAWKGLQADGLLDAVASAVQRHGRQRLALVLGTSTSSIEATEQAYRHVNAEGHFECPPANPALQSLHALGAFVQEASGIEGPCFTVSTACSSSAKAVAAAHRLMRLGIADAVLVGGVDSLCGNVLFGFQSLQLLSNQPCRPFDLRRDGINLGEGAAFLLLERGPGALQLLGYGESSDAHHMSAPHPEGLGAELALNAALERSGLDRAEVDYIHLHGTATPKNDETEAALLKRRYTDRTPASSSKGMLGHTLGAAGAVGSAFALMALETGWLAGTVNTTTLDPAFPPGILLQSRRQPVNTASVHAFGFGGTNAVLIWGRGNEDAP
jgi:3-oxoacyl-[acyl-carrier-protein] synthase I